MITHFSPNAGDPWEVWRYPQIEDFSKLPVAKNQALFVFKKDNKVKTVAFHAVRFVDGRRWDCVNGVSDASHPA